MATTPLEREILTHYATTAGPYRGGSANWTETHAKIVERFIDLGLLIAFKGADGARHVRSNEEALRAYMGALATVPLPVQRWVVPSAHDTRCGRDNWSPPAAAHDDWQDRLAELEHEVRDLQASESVPRRPRYEVEDD